MVGKYDVGGRGHRMLERLAQGPASRDTLAGLIRRENQSFHSAKNRVFRFVIQFRQDAMATEADDLVHILPAGLAELERLGAVADAQPSMTSVRIFRQAQEVAA